MCDIWVVTLWTSEDNNTEVLYAFDQHYSAEGYAKEIADQYKCTRVDEWTWEFVSGCNRHALVKLVNVERARY